jgi:hypothetical protein
MIHEWSRSWQATAQGYEMEIHGDLLSELERDEVAQSIRAFEIRDRGATH